MTYIATFHTHYGAMKFFNDCERRGIAANPMPVPRALSASCGTCVRFETERPDIKPSQYDLEGCYLVAEGGKYSAVTLIDID